MNSDEIIFFDPWAEIEHTRNRLPHWQQSGATYFVTWRLADSIPKAKLDQHHGERLAWLKFHPRPWTPDVEGEYHRLFSLRIDRFLDAGHGACQLRRGKNAQVLSRALDHFEGRRYSMISYVIMPNHTHLLFSINPVWKIGDLVHSWKRQSAREINRLENRSGALWQKDYFDRLIRDAKHLANCVRYIRNNPGKAHLKPGEYVLYESRLAKAIV